jgi:hypothetical protein
MSAIMLNFTEATCILVTLGLLKDDKYSRLCFSPTEIARESNMGILRTAINANSAKISLARNRDWNRDLNALSPLLEKVILCLAEITDIAVMDAIIGRVKKAQEGLSDLISHQYSQDESNSTFIKNGLAVFEKAQITFQQKREDLQKLTTPELLKTIQKLEARILELENRLPLSQTSTDQEKRRQEKKREATAFVTEWDKRLTSWQNSFQAGKLDTATESY